MSAATPASQVRRPVPGAQPQSGMAHASMHRGQARQLEPAEDEFRLHLNDLPRIENDLEVDGFRPTLLSRLFDLIGIR
ncbi:MAG TPA: hypothetical protein VF161_13870 [Steroidobacteraceae bacterium]